MKMSLDIKDIAIKDIAWKDYKIYRVKDIRDIILSIDSDEELEQFVKFMLPIYPMDDLLNWLLHYTKRLSPESPQWLGAVDRERLQLALRYSSA
jgi:hypothetical protein